LRAPYEIGYHLASPSDHLQYQWYGVQYIHDLPLGATQVFSDSFFIPKNYIVRRNTLLEPSDIWIVYGVFQCLIRLKKIPSLGIQQRRAQGRPS
jgi:hypothetical protein